MLVRFAYLAVCGTLQFLVRGRRGEAEREAGLLIFRHGCRCYGAPRSDGGSAQKTEHYSRGSLACPGDDGARA